MDAAILAGGRARRFGGRDKSALPVGPTSILDRQLAALAGLADRVFIVAGTAKPFRNARVPVIRDRLPNAGALGGLYTALVSARSDHVLILACDLPFVTASLLARLSALASAGWDAVVPRPRDGLQPLCAVYARHLAPLVRARVDAGHLKVADLLVGVRHLEVGPEELATFDPDGRLFFNVNTPDDLDRAVRLAGRAEGAPGR